jgi:hypothetical protein
LSYCFLPFIFKVGARPGTNEREVDMSVKDNCHLLVPEMLHWGILLAPHLLDFQGRRLAPRPEKIDADTASHYVGADTSSSNAAVTHLLMRHLEPWDNKARITGGVKPSTRKEIDKRFFDVTGLNAREHFPAFLLESNPDSPQRNYLNQKWEGSQYAVYKAHCGNDGKLWDGIGDKPPLAVVTLRAT